MKAKRDNKVYRINEASKARYLKDGYDIYDDNGKLLEHSPKKVIPYSEHAAKVAELEEKLAAKGDQKDNPDAVEILKLFAADRGIDIGQSSSISGILKKIKDQIAEV